MRWLDLAMAVVAVISLIGSVFAMYVLVQVGEAVSALSAFDLSVFGITGVESIVGTLQLFLTIGWIWIIVVFFTSLYAIYVSVSRIRGKK